MKKSGFFFLSEILGVKKAIMKIESVDSESEDLGAFCRPFLVLYQISQAAPVTITKRVLKMVHFRKHGQQQMALVSLEKSRFDNAMGDRQVGFSREENECKTQRRRRR